MNKKLSVLLFALLASSICVNCAIAKDVVGTLPQSIVTQPNSIVEQQVSPERSLSSLSTNDSQKNNEVPVTNQISQKLVAPVVPQVNKTSHSKKIDLRAVVFDPKADFKAQAEEEGREMTKLEQAEDNVHEALHGEVQEMGKMSKKGLLYKYLTVKPEGGPFESLNVWNCYRGDYKNVWLGENYKNTLGETDSAFTVLEGKIRNTKLTFRSMFLFNPGKDGHDFFNDVWGDQYLMYNWSKQDQLLFGFSRNAVGIEGSSSPTTLPLFARSQIAKTYNNVRALGAKAQGSHKMYDYNVGFFSSGRNFVDWFPGPEFVGSFGIKPLGMTDGRYGKLLIGGGLDAGNAESHYAVGSAYVDYEYKRLNATIEYGSADGSNGSTGFTTAQSEGINGTIAYRVTPKWQVLLRYDQFDPNKTKANDIRREYTAGVNYFIKEQSLKLIFNYTMYSIETGVCGSQILVGTQILI